MRIRTDAVTDEEFPNAEVVNSASLQDSNEVSLDGESIIAIDTETGEAIKYAKDENGEFRTDTGWSVVRLKIRYAYPVTIVKKD